MLTPDEVCDEVLRAFALSGKRAIEDDIMRRMGVAVSAFITGLNGLTDHESQRLALSCFLVGYMAHEEGWADWEAWRDEA